jgi:phosphate/phosphite/phosphonate ABC transporter binding protein
MERLIEEFSAEEPMVVVEHFRSTHTGLAIGALQRGAFDLAYLTREPTAEERPGLYIYPFGKDPLVFAVHKGAGVPRLTTQQIRDLYAGRIRNWADLGGADLAVVLLDRPEYTSPKVALRFRVFKDLEIDAAASMFERPELMDTALEHYQGALGYTSLHSALALRDHVDILPLDGIRADVDATRSGLYPLTRTVSFATRYTVSMAAKKLIDFAASDHGRRIVTSHTLVPMHREIVLAVPPVRSVLALDLKYGELARYLGEHLGRPVELVYRHSYTDLADALSDGRVDAAFLGSFSYALTRQRLGAEVLARPEHDGGSRYRGVFYVRANSPYRDIVDLKGARVAHAGKATTAGHIFPLYALKTRGLAPPAEFFGTFYEASSHEGAIRGLVEDRADAAAAKDLVFEEMVRENPGLRADIRELACSSPVPSNGFVTGPWMDPGLRRQIRRLLLEMDRSPRGREALGDMGAKRFIATTDSDYANLHQMIDAVSEQLVDFHQHR